MLSHQLGLEAYFNDIRKKLAEADTDRSALTRKLTEIENTLKRTEVTLEETCDQLEGKKARAAKL